MNDMIHDRSDAGIPRPRFEKPQVYFVAWKMAVIMGSNNHARAGYLRVSGTGFEGFLL